VKKIYNEKYPKRVLISIDIFLKSVVHICISVSLVTF